MYIYVSWHSLSIDRSTSKVHFIYLWNSYSRCPKYQKGNLWDRQLVSIDLDHCHRACKVKFWFEITCHCVQIIIHVLLIKKRIASYRSVGASLISCVVRLMYMFKLRDSKKVWSLIELFWFWIPDCWSLAVMLFLFSYINLSSFKCIQNNVSTTLTWISAPLRPPDLQTKMVADKFCKSRSAAWVTFQVEWFSSILLASNSH